MIQVIKDEKKIFQEALEFHQAANFADAEILYNEILETHPANIDAIFYLGTLKLQQGEFEEARLLLEKTTTLKPDYETAYNNLATTLKKQGKLDEAVTVYNKSIALQPDYVYASDYLDRQYSYNTTSVDPENRILKYRFNHTFKLDIEYIFKKFSIGMSARYFSRMINLDQSIFDFEEHTKSIGGNFPPILYEDYYNNHNNGNTIFDARVGFEINEKNVIRGLCFHLSCLSNPYQSIQSGS